MSLRRTHDHRFAIVRWFGSRARERAAIQWLREVLAEEKVTAGLSWDSRPLASSRSSGRGCGGSPRRRVLAPAVAGLALFGMASGMTMPSPGDASGASEVLLTAEDRSTEAFVVGADGLWPGKEVERTITVANASAVPFTSIALRASALISSLLDTDPVDGLQLRVDRCSTPWRAAEDGESFMCPGVMSAALAQKPAIGSDRVLAGLAATRPEGADYLRLVLGLPETAGNEFQGQSSRLRFSFTGAGRPPQQPPHHGR